MVQVQPPQAMQQPQASQATPEHPITLQQPNPVLAADQVGALIEAAKSF